MQIKPHISYIHNDVSCQLSRHEPIKKKNRIYQKYHVNKIDGYMVKLIFLDHIWCSDQILTLVKIVTRVPLHRERRKQRTNSACQLAYCG